MRRVCKLFVAAITVSASACSTTSFAPPAIQLEETHAANAKTLDGGLEFVSVYIEEYRVAGAKLSNGRQLFDVPGLVGAVGGATAVALGANADVAIGVGALGALTTSAKTYYAPNERADVYYDAVEALTCVRQETIGFGAKTKTAKAVMATLKAQTSAGLGGLGTSPEDSAKRSALEASNTAIDAFTELVVDNDQRAGLLLKNTALTIENKARVRLSEKGKTTDAAAISALVLMYQKQIEDAKKKPPAEGVVKSSSLFSSASLDGADFVINLDELAPKLAQCALLANG